MEVAMPVEVKSPLHDPVISVLKNSLILDHILANITLVEDLKSFRSVCSNWRDASQRKWAATAVLPVIWKVAKTRQSCCPLREVRGLHLTDFLIGYGKGFYHTRFENIKIMNYDIHSPINVPERSRTIFWEILAPHVKSLNLDHISLHGCGSFMELSNLLMTCPNILECAAGPFRMTDDETTVSLPDILVPWVRQLPPHQIKCTFKLECDSYLKYEWIVDGRPEYDQMDTLKITERACNGNDMQITREVLYALKGRLKSLEWHHSRDYPPDPLDLNFVRSLENQFFPCLTHIRIYEELEVSLRPLQHAPNLTDLHIQLRYLEFDWNSRIALDEFQEKRNNKVLFPNLKTLHINYATLNGASLRVLGKWMPSLTLFEMVSHRRSLNMVRQIWQQLEILVMLPRSLVKGTKHPIRRRRIIKIANLPPLDQLQP